MAICLIGKSAILTGPFSSSQTVNVYQRVKCHGELGVTPMTKPPNISKSFPKSKHYQLVK
jgi:hypothetical protein